MGQGDRLPDFSETAERMQVVDPGSASDPFKEGSSTNQQTASPDGGASAGQPGPTGEAAPAQSATPAQPAAAAPSETVTLDEDTVVDEAEYEKLATQLREELKAELLEEHQTELRTQQSGQDRAMAGLQAQLAAEREAREEMNLQLRDLQLNGLSPEDQEKQRASWEITDKVKAVDDYRAQVEAVHEEVDVLVLLNTYGEFGVTEEQLLATPFEERELLCTQARADFWEKQAKGGQQNGQTATNGQQAPVPAKEAPAGASAPSDTGGGGGIVQTKPRNEEPGLDAMAENIGSRDSWEQVSFRTRRG